VPSSLVERRPDVRAAEAQLHAATAEVGVAIANMLPQITLSGAIGNVATQSGQIFSGMNEFWTVGASLSQTLFAGARSITASGGASGRGPRRRPIPAGRTHGVSERRDALRALAADADAVRTQERAFDASTRTLRLRGSSSHSVPSAIWHSSMHSKSAAGHHGPRAGAHESICRYRRALTQALGGTARAMFRSHVK